MASDWIKFAQKNVNKSKAGNTFVLIAVIRSRAAIENTIIIAKL